MELKDLPTLAKALTLMAYDNGMVFRGAREGSVVDELFNSIADSYTNEQFLEVEKELAALDEEQLDLAVTGTCDEPRPIANDGLTDRMLNDAFNGEE